MNFRCFLFASGWQRISVRQKTSLRLLASCMCAVVLSICLPCHGQQTPLEPRPIPLDPFSQSSTPNPLVTTLQPGTLFLFDLERKFAAAVAQGGGPTFASFFDDNGMVLENLQPAWIGKAAIAQHSTWSPTTYQLTWTPEGGELSPGGDMGYTWGQYEGRSIGVATNAAVEHGRYVTVWKKEKNGTWKILMDTSNQDPPEAECKCSVNGIP